MNFESNHDIVKRLQVEGDMTKDDMEEILTRLKDASDTLLEIANAAENAYLNNKVYEHVDGWIYVLQEIVGTKGLFYKNALLDNIY